MAFSKPFIEALIEKYCGNDIDQSISLSFCTQIIYDFCEGTCIGYQFDNGYIVEGEVVKKTKDNKKWFIVVNDRWHQFASQNYFWTDYPSKHIVSIPDLHIC